MVSQRNRIIDIINYLESCGIKINIGKNKAIGNRGFFKVSNNSYRIDVAKNLDDDSIIKTLSHEFAHFIHFQYDKTLNSLNFIFDENDDVTEELISATVLTIPKKDITPLFNQKTSLEREILNLKSKLKLFPDNYKTIENKIKKTNLKYLLNYDNVKIIEGFKFKLYTVNALSYDNDVNLLLHLRSKQRLLKKVNSKISKLNKYYNSPTELFARSFELFITNSNSLKTNAPIVYSFYDDALRENKIPLLTNFVNLFK